MRYAIFSDIHGNLQALQTVLADIREKKPDLLICLGDLVGYGASPNECIDEARASGAEILAGNHDHAATGQLDIQYFNDFARAAILWTRATLSDERLDFLAALPYVVRHPGVLAVHASPLDPEAWEYVLSLSEAARQIRAYEESICFIGHSHYPGLYCVKGGHVDELDLPDNEVVTLSRDCRYLVNVGSVGQPRDNDPRAAWALYDQVKGEVTLNRLDYDIDAAQSLILDAELPPFLASRLQVGI